MSNDVSDLSKTYQARLSEIDAQFNSIKNTEAKLKEQRDQLNQRLLLCRDEQIKLTGAWEQINELLAGLKADEKPGEEEKEKDPR